jgi:hypothetical protein
MHEINSSLVRRCHCGVAALNCRPFETRSLPAASSPLYLDHSHCLVLAPATLAALPSTRAIPDRDVFYLGNPFP